MKRSFAMALALLTIPIFPGYCSDWTITGHTVNAPSAIAYQTGEPITFHIQATAPTELNNYTIRWQCSGDDGKSSAGEAPAAKPLRVTTSVACPGFVRITAVLIGPDGQNIQIKGQPVRFDGGAGAELEKIRPLPEPGDFCEFWQKQKARLDQIPIRWKERLIRKENGIAYYAISADCAGPRPMTGYLAIPENTKPGSLAGELYFDGYGVYRTGPYPGAPGRMVLHVNAHGYELEQDDEYYRQFGKAIQFKGQIYAFSTEENAAPENAYFNGMALRVMRAVQFIQSRPEWDGKNLTVSGESQGGLQALWAAGLSAGVSECIIGIPWCCDIGAGGGRQQSDFAPAPAPGLKYYSAAHHARRISPDCRVLITRAGLGDYICPPIGVAAMFNNLRGAATIRWCQGSTHNFIPAEPQYFTQSK